MNLLLLVVSSRKSYTAMSFKHLALILSTHIVFYARGLISMLYRRIPCKNDQVFA